MTKEQTQAIQRLRCTQMSYRAISRELGISISTVCSYCRKLGLDGKAAKNYRTRLERYLSSMLQAKSMLVAGIFSQHDFEVVDKILSEKYGFSKRNLYRGIDAIYSEVFGNNGSMKKFVGGLSIPV